MDDIEVRRGLEDSFQHQEVRRQPIDRVWIESNSRWTRWNESGARHRVTAGKESDVMSLPYQFFRKVVNDAFGSSLKFGRHAFIKRRYLCDSHYAATI